MSKLTNKQEMFCKEYLIDLNSTAAAIRAGYSEKTARQIGSRLLTNVDIQAFIQELMLERSKRVEMDADYVLERYKKIIDDDIKNYLSFGMEEVTRYDKSGEPITGNEFVVTGKDSKDVDTWNISEVTMTKDGAFKFKLHCKDNALRDVGRHLGMFTDKVEHSGSIDISEKSKIIASKLFD
ncbi:terminase small subunit [bacterium]|nr:terminase small subunit [bacterium]